jgi:dTDP-4-dehydrorhamnose 3,5-epimerase
MVKFKELKRSNRNWLLPGATKDTQSVTRDWQFTTQKTIEGVSLKEVDHVPKENGYLTELFRKDWNLDDFPVEQVFQVTLSPGKISAWHSHEHATDRIFVNQGQMKLVLYDRRSDSATCGYINEFRIGILRPTLVVIPPKVWHGLQNLSDKMSSVLNLVDKSYTYEDPDHWRLPWDTHQIPYTFKPTSEIDIACSSND